MPIYRSEKCEDCPNIIERREADLKYRESVIRELATQGANIETLTKEVGYLRRDMKTVLFRIALLSGGAGTITGLITSLVVTHLSK